MADKATYCGRVVCIVFYSILISSSLVSAAGVNVTYESHSSFFCVCSPCFEIYMYMYMQIKKCLVSDLKLTFHSVTCTMIWFTFVVCKILQTECDSADCLK